MIYLLSFLLTMFCMQQETIFDFKKSSNINDWRVINDGVMGGLSKGSFDLSSDGHAVFHGHVSTRNNGGFSSVRFSSLDVKVSKKSKVILKIKGDGKKYQFRIKNNKENYYSYITTFQTSGDWEEIVIPIKNMFASFRGRKLNQANFSHNTIEEVAFLIANKKEEDFKLIIDSIELN